MQKPADLRAHLVARLPELERDPERLKMWLDRGTIRATQSAGHGFVYDYTLNLVVTDWTDHPSILMVLILDWLRRHQPDLIASSAAPGFSFEADIIDKDVIDLSIDLALSEVVTVARRVDGGFDMEHQVEPETMFPDDLPIVDGDPTLTELWWRGERVLPLPDGP